MSDDVEMWLKELLALNEDEDKMTDKQMKILKAAVEMFSEKGYAATSTSEIAQKAGVAEGTIFRHYKTKKELLLSIVGPVMARFVAPFVLRDFTKVLDMPYQRYEDFVRAVIRNRYEFVKKHQPILRILIQEIPFHTELREQFLEHVGKKVFERIKKIVEHFQAQGDIIDMPPESVMRLTISVAFGFFVARFILLPQADWDDEAEIERSIAFIHNGLAPRTPEAPR